jgi:L-amino acid N-acyltransferase YncA
MKSRDASISDLPLIVEIYNSTIDSRMVTADTTPVSVDDKTQWFYLHNKDTRPLWIFESDDQIIGWASFQDFYGRPAYSGTAELSIYLQESQRKKGFGKMVLEYCISKAPALHIETLLGFIFAHNIPSIRLFENAGFTEWAHLPDIAEMDNNKYSLKILGLKIKP